MNYGEVIEALVVSFEDGKLLQVIHVLASLSPQQRAYVSASVYGILIVANRKSAITWHKFLRAECYDE